MGKKVMSVQPSTNTGNQRNIARDSLFVLAQIRIIGRDGEHRIKIRNLSAGGLMAEGDLRVVRGTPVAIDVRNIGWVEGTVAWVADNRFGVAFTTEIDPLAVRASSTPAATGSGFVPMRPLAAINSDPKQLRKI